MGTVQRGSSERTEVGAYDRIPAHLPPRSYVLTDKNHGNRTSGQGRMLVAEMVGSGGPSRTGLPNELGILLASSASLRGMASRSDAAPGRLQGVPGRRGMLSICHVTCQHAIGVLAIAGGYCYSHLPRDRGITNSSPWLLSEPARGLTYGVLYEYLVPLSNRPRARVSLVRSPTPSHSLAATEWGPMQLAPFGSLPHTQSQRQHARIWWGSAIITACDPAPLLWELVEAGVTSQSARKQVRVSG